MKPCNECHNCGSTWHPGTEEYDWQQCSACGWRPGDPIDEDDDNDFYDDDDEFNQELQNEYYQDHPDFLKAESAKQNPRSKRGFNNKVKL